MAANKYINLYMGDVTEGGKDGTQVSPDDAETSPIAVVLDAAKAESKTVKVAIRCESGYETGADTVISFSGANKSKWTACATETGTFSDTLTLTSSIGETNKLFYIKAASTSDEDPLNDSTTNLSISTKVQVKGH